MSKTLIISITVVICAALLFIFLKYFNKEESKTITLFCGPNNTLPVVVYKDPNAAFPDFAEEFNYKVSGSVSLLDSLSKLPEIKGNASVDLNNRIVELRDKLNNESSRMQMIMRSNFLAFNQKPCDTSVSRKYYEVLTLMAEKNMELEKLKASVTEPHTRGAVDSVQLVVSRDTAELRSALQSFSAEYKFIQ